MDGRTDWQIDGHLGATVITLPALAKFAKLFKISNPT